MNHLKKIHLRQVANEEQKFARFLSILPLVCDHLRNQWIILFFGIFLCILCVQWLKIVLCLFL